MDDIGNIIYIVLLLIGLASGLFKKKKEQKAPPTYERETEYETPSGPTRQEIREATAQREEVDRNAKQLLEELKVKGKEARLSRIQQKIKRHSKEDPIAVEEGRTEEVNGFKFNPDELRKAVIYSEILNPPYL